MICLMANQILMGKGAACSSDGRSSKLGDGRINEETVIDKGSSIKLLMAPRKVMWNAPHETPSTIA